MALNRSYIAVFDGKKRDIAIQVEADVYKELGEIVEESIVLYKEKGKSLPPETAGKELHKALAIRALQADESLNSFCLNSLKKVIFRSNRNWERT